MENMATVDSVLGQTQDAVGLCRRKVLVSVQAEGPVHIMAFKC